VVHNILLRILAAIKAIDSTARIIATNKDCNETEFTGEQPMPLNQDDAQAFINQFIEDQLAN
jgi:hypothetical protein